QGGYSVRDTTFDTLDSLIDHALGGLLDDNDPDIQFNKFVQTFDIYDQKYKGEPFISEEDRKKDLSFLSSLVQFYKNFPITDEFKNSDLYDEFVKRVNDFEDFFNREVPEVEDHQE